MARDRPARVFGELTRADLEAEARQYAQATVRLADTGAQVRSTSTTAPRLLTPQQHAEEAQRLHAIARRRAECAREQARLGHSLAAQAFAADTAHFGRLAAWHAQEALRGESAAA